MNRFDKCTVFLIPEDAWDFFQEHKFFLASKTIEIATNEETDYSVYMTEFYGLPYFMVYKGSKVLYTENATSSSSCLDVLSRIYTTYLVPVEEESSKFIQDEELNKKEDEVFSEFDDIIAERENELYLAMQDFLCVLFDCDANNLESYYGSDIIPALIDDVCTTMASDYSISVYRPTWIEDSTDHKTFEEFPYSDPDENQ